MTIEIEIQVRRNNDFDFVNYGFSHNQKINDFDFDATVTKCIETAKKYYKTEWAKLSEINIH